MVRSIEQGEMNRVIRNALADVPDRRHAAVDLLRGRQDQRQQRRDHEEHDREKAEREQPYLVDCLRRHRRTSFAASASARRVACSSIAWTVWRMFSASSLVV